MWYFNEYIKYWFINKWKKKSKLCIGQGYPPPPHKPPKGTIMKIEEINAKQNTKKNIYNCVVCGGKLQTNKVA